MRAFVVAYGIALSAASEDASTRRLQDYGLSQAASAVNGAANAVGGAVTQAGNAVAYQAGSLATATQRAAISKGLQAANQCPAIWNAIPDIVQLFDPYFIQMSLGLQTMDEDPAKDNEACANVIRGQVNEVIEDNLQEGQGRGSGQILVWEREAAKWAAYDAGADVCKDYLHETLVQNSGIRKSHPHQYRAVVEEKLRKALPQLLSKEFAIFCPVDNQKLFAVGRRWFANPASSILRVAAVLTGTTGFLLLSVAAVLAIRRFVWGRHGTIFYRNVELRQDLDASSNLADAEA